MPTRETPASKNCLPDSFQKLLNAYALTASAVGVGVLALAAPSDAEIIYTPAHVVIGAGGAHNYGLDLNADGATDFEFVARHGCDTDQCIYYLFVKPKPGNGMMGISQGNSFIPSASALYRGAEIGKTQNFVRKIALMATFYEGGGGYSAHGPWANVKDRYLGLAFRVDGQIHFGWARLSVRDERVKITAVLTGYAYETIPGKTIRAGQTSEQQETVRIVPEAPTEVFSSPASLGVLALGAPGLEAWRRNQQGSSH